MESKIQDYPTLRRRGPGVVNVDTYGYDIAQSRRRQAGRLDNVERDVCQLSVKVDRILELLTSLHPQVA